MFVANRLPSWFQPSRWGDATFTGVISLSFLGLALLGVWRHEMWSDELMFWMMARDNHTWGDLLYTLRFEYMHPFLWGVLLHGLSRLTRSPLAMQLFHITIATGCVILLCQRSPLPRWQKALISFGYFFIYEYSVISRNYGLGVLVMFAICSLFATRRRSYLILAGLLALLANVNFYSRMTAIALTALLILEWWRDRREQKTVPTWNLALSLGIVGLGLLLSAMQNIPPDTGTSGSILGAGPRWGTIVSAIANLWRAFFPMPGLSLRFWNSNLIDDGYGAALAWIPLGFSVALFSRRPLILFLYLFNLSEIILFHSLWTGLMRHLGHIFILFIVCLWLSPQFPGRSPQLEALSPARFPRWAWWQQSAPRFVGVVLVVQVIAGAYAYGMDLVHPFSQAKLVAQWVRQNRLETATIAGALDVFTQSVSGHLDLPIFYPERQRLGTYISSDNQAQRLLAPDLLARVTQSATTEPVILVLTSPLPEGIFPSPPWRLEPLPSLPPAIVKVENYSLYRLQRQSGGG